MFAQIRPDIARAVEETVVNLKGLEQTLEVLRNDLAWLAQSIGHPQAAQIALTPSRNYGISPGLNIPGFYGAFPNPSFATPFQASFAGVPPLGFLPNVSPFAAPYGVPNFGTPYGVPTNGTNPLVVPPTIGTSPYAQLFR